MNIERVKELINRVVPGGVAAIEQREREELQAERIALSDADKKDDERHLTERKSEDAALEKKQAEVEKKRKGLAADEAQLAAMQRRRQNKSAARAATRRMYERQMRDRRPPILDLLMGRVDRLLDDAVAPTVHDYDRSVIPQLLITLSGDASERRRALFALRRDIDQVWMFEPLTDDGFEQKFAQSVSALPAIQAPPTIEAMRAARLAY